MTLRAHHVDSVRQAPPPAVAHRFALLNLYLPRDRQGTWKAQGVPITIAPVDNYDEAASTLYTRDRQAVTALLTVETDDAATASSVAEIAGSLQSIRRTVIDANRPPNASLRNIRTRASSWATGL
jgi:hypothetical protein